MHFAAEFAQQRFHPRGTDRIVEVRCKRAQVIDAEKGRDSPRGNQGQAAAIIEYA
jgi:hypothetical protein